MNILIRPYQSEDFHFLVDMFYQSLYVPEGKDEYDRSILEKPELQKYYVDWGRLSDYGFVASNDQENIGAVWTRFFSKEDPGYGFVEACYPEVGIAVKPEYRGKGIGSRLLTHISQHLRTQKIPGVSLSVDRRNPAYHLYLKQNFVPVKETENSVTMLRLWEPMG